MSTEISHLEYKGYKGILKLSSKDNRLWGKICTPENPTTPIDGWGFAGDDIQEAEKIFRYQVEKIISQKKGEPQSSPFCKRKRGDSNPRFLL